jgi:cyclohexanecarboxylate-CoA ligase
VKPGTDITFEDMSAFLAKEKLAKNYFPEKLVKIDEMPRTASGKIQKFRLREMAAALASSSS